MASLQVPSTVLNDVPRNLAVSHHKAAQFRWWGLVAMPHFLYFALHSSGRDDVVRLVRDISQFMCSMFVLAKKPRLSDGEFDELSSDVVDIVKSYETLFGSSEITINLHMFLHSPLHVRRWRDLTDVWAFVGERGNGSLGDAARHANTTPEIAMQRDVERREFSRVAKTEKGICQLLECISPPRMNKFDDTSCSGGVLVVLVDEAVKRLVVDALRKKGVTVMNSWICYEHTSWHFNGTTIARAQSQSASGGSNNSRVRIEHVSAKHVEVQRVLRLDGNYPTLHGPPVLAIVKAYSSITHLYTKAHSNVNYFDATGNDVVRLISDDVFAVLVEDIVCNVTLAPLDDGEEPVRYGVLPSLPAYPDSVDDDALR
eukprot:TRINITY_DN271_c0_g1_i10.p1 TRINITY_DN271_c0_g1~~TRINITY_DN271_c0_g1_i10.p1  ORF type:complete len:371 (-),score=62.41 TRINITY_DN271_c0_g1_i10:259-1371(-)